MSRLVLTVLWILASASSALAHVVFVVPEPGGGEAYVFLSEDLDPDDDVSVAMLAGTRLFLRSPHNGDIPLEMEAGEFANRVEFSDPDARLVFGTLELGVHQFGDKPGYLVTYYPKTILRDPFAPSSVIGGDHPVELIPVGQIGEVRFKVLANGEPQAGVEVTVFLPDGAREAAVTDDAGMTEAFGQTGRYGAWARTKIGEAGVHEDQDYVEARGYATLVAQVGDANRVASRKFYAPLPQATSSFGAVESDGWLYVYGGHIARTHDYDTEAVSGRFHRLNLDDGIEWQSLPEGPALQGMNLACHDGKVYRVGGMQPRNSRGAKSDNYSVADCVRFDPGSMEWEWMAPMPQARSSHDIAVVHDKLYVIGGWNMLGRESGNDWIEDMYTLDLTDPTAAWKSVAQPFSRRALIVAVHQERIYVIGGMDEEDEVSRRVDIFDPATMQWSRGPELIGEADHAGFASAACVLDGRLYASVAGGDLLRLSEDGAEWEQFGSNTPRIVHRLVPWRSQILVTGGADDGGNLDLIETIVPARMVNSGDSPPQLDRTVPVASVPDSAAASVAGQVYCPVMTNVEIVDDEDAIAVDYQGQEVLLCCSKCVKKWKRDPVAYLSPTVLPQLAAEDLPRRSIRQVYCPVFPTRVISEQDPFVMHDGVKIYLFNKTAVRRWNEDPGKYLDLILLPQLAE